MIDIRYTFITLLKAWGFFALLTGLILLFLIRPIQLVEADAQYFAETQLDSSIQDEETKDMYRELHMDFYLDSIADIPILNLGLIQANYESLKRTQLSWGLAPRKGRFIVLGLDKEAFLEGLMGYPHDQEAVDLLDLIHREKGAYPNILERFAKYDEEYHPGKPLGRFFNENYRLEISLDMSDEAVITKLKASQKEALDMSYNKLKYLFNRGVGGQFVTVKYLPEKGFIQLFMPAKKWAHRYSLGGDGTELNFWETYSSGELFGTDTDPGPLVLLNRALQRNPKYGNPDSSKNDAAFLLTIESIQLMENLSSTQKDSLSYELEKKYLIQEHDTTLLNPLFGHMHLGDIGNGKAAFEAYFYTNDTALVKEMLNSPEAKRLLPKNLFFEWGNKPTEHRFGGYYFTLYALKAPYSRRKASKLRGDNIKIVEAVKSPLDAGYAIEIDFDEAGAKVWEQMTSQNLRKSIAISFNNKVITMPTVQSVMKGGNLVISGSFSKKEAEELATMLSFNRLPARTEILMEETIDVGRIPTFSYLCFFTLMVSAIPATIFALLANWRRNIILHQTKKTKI